MIHVIASLNVIHVTECKGSSKEEKGLGKRIYKETETTEKEDRPSKKEGTDSHDQSKVLLTMFVVIKVCIYLFPQASTFK